MENLDVMISYSHKDGVAIAQRVVDTLTAEGVSCWWDRHIVPGSDWDVSITKAIDACKILLLVLTDESNNSDQVKKELKLLTDYNRNGILIPFKVTRDDYSINIRHVLVGKQWIDVPDPENTEHFQNMKTQVVSLLSHLKQSTTASTQAASIVTSLASEKTPTPVAPAWNLETPFANLIETHFAKYPDLIPLAKHITSGWNYGVEMQTRTGEYIEIATSAGTFAEFDPVDKTTVWCGLAIGADAKSLLLLITTGVDYFTYDCDATLEGDDSAISYYKLLGWQGDFMKTPSIVDTQGNSRTLEGMLGISVSLDNADRIQEAKNMVSLLAWELRWLDKWDAEDDANNPLDSCRKDLKSSVDRVLRRSPALWETFAVYYHEICNGETLCNLKFSKNNDRFVTLTGIYPNMDIYADQVDHMSYLIIRKVDGYIETPEHADSKKMDLYLASAGWKWDILDQVTTREQGKAGESRVETDLVALPIKLYDVDYTAKAEVLKRIVRDYGAE